MSDAKIARIIFEKWASELMNKDRGWDHILSNFDELFYELYRASVPFDVVHDLVKEAIAKHFPNNAVAKFTYDKSPKKKEVSFKEYLDEWKEGINDFAHQAFFAYYSVNPNEEDPSEEEKKYGNMGTKEYIAQRKYAQSFPEVDLIALRKQRAELQAMLDNNEDKNGDTDRKPS